MSSAGATGRALAARYRRTQRRVEHALFERGMEPTWTGDATSGYLFLPRGLWREHIGREDTLLDYGSGRGRVLLQAARLYPFGRVIGVELHEREAAIARANALTLKRPRCTRIEIVTADVTVWPVPDDVTYVYMFNPFKGDTFRAVVERMTESLQRRPRPLTVIYANPMCAPELLDSGAFARVRTSLGPRRDLHSQRVEVFRAIVPRAGAG